MPQALIKRGVWVATTLIVAVILVLLTVPMVASTQIVRDRIALQLSAWTGYRVEIGDAPKIEIWPTFRATLSNVRFSDWQDHHRKPVIEAERIEVGLSAVAALSGNAVLSDARLLRPVIHVTPAGHLLFTPDWPASGRIANMVVATRDALAANPTKPDLGFVPEDELGTVEFVDGQVMVENDGSSQAIVTGLAGSFRWPALNRPASVTATAIWRGEAASLEATLGQPLVLFAGGTSHLTVALKAAPVNADFNGTANLANMFIDGQLTSSSPSIRRMLEWTASTIDAPAAYASFAVSGHVVGDARRIKIEDVSLSLNNNSSGTGVLDFTRGDRLGVSGTLAFENLDLAALFYAFTPLGPGTAAIPITINPSPVDRLDMDVRLSAVRASFGSFPMENVAATLQGKNGISAFDISDATVFGGNVQAGVRYDRMRDGGFLELSVVGRELDAAAVAEGARISRFEPIGRISGSVMLRGEAPNWEQFLASAEGSISGAFGPGRIAGINLAAFLDRAAKGGFFALAEIPSDAMEVEAATLKATVGSGFARLDQADITMPDNRVSLIGIVPIVGRGLALSGSIMPKPQAGGPAAQALARFFIGGSWLAPFVSPAVPSAAETVPLSPG